MKGSFVFPGFDNENNDISSYDFDPQTDFSQFLEEARKHSTTQDKEIRRGNHETVQRQGVISNQESKKSKKSWKSALFPFWRSSSDRKTKKHCKETSRDDQVTISKPRGYVSGPIYGARGAAAASSGRYRDRLAASGPLAGLFQHKNEEENDGLAYVSLDKLNKPAYDAKVYGPVYLVS